jgi:hypothetical protein
LWPVWSGKGKSFKAIDKNKYAQMAQDFCSTARRNNGRIASYATIITTQQTGKKTSQLGIFFAGNRLIKLCKTAKQGGRAGVYCPVVT